MKERVNNNSNKARVVIIHCFSLTFLSVQLFPAMSAVSLPIHGDLICSGSTNRVELDYNRTVLIIIIRKPDLSFMLFSLIFFQSDYSQPCLWYCCPSNIHGDLVRSRSANRVDLKTGFSLEDPGKTMTRPARFIYSILRWFNP